MDILGKIEEGKVDQMKGSIEVGELLKKMYIDSALKTGDRIIIKMMQEMIRSHVFAESKNSFLEGI